MVHLHHRNLLQTMVATIFPPFYRHRAAREQYFCRFIVTARRGNNTFVFLSSPRGAETIFLPFYRHRAAREQYFRVLSSPRGAETIFPPFQCLQCSCKYIPERFWLLQANCERSEMWREPREDGGGPHAEGKMKSSHPK